MTELFNRLLGQATEHDFMKQNTFVLWRGTFHFKGFFHYLEIEKALFLAQSNNNILILWTQFLNDTFNINLLIKSKSSFITGHNEHLKTILKKKKKGLKKGALLGYPVNT